MNKKKGFTLVELLVVIAIIALLMGILMPALARVRQIAYRLYCGTNLSGIGKAMLIYSNDYDDDFPRAGTTGWSANIANWLAATEVGAFGTAGTATITSQFYLLIKYAEVTPKSFLCKGDSGVVQFAMGDYAGTAGIDIVDVWDFGGGAGHKTQKHCSYAYHSPYSGYDITSSSDPGMAVAGDPNPWLDCYETKDRVEQVSTAWGDFVVPGDKESESNGNALTHQEDGQNVLFVDGHTSMEKKSFCGIDDDNIYTLWTGTGASVNKIKGAIPGSPGVTTSNRNDSLLVTDNGASVTSR
ncbi:MAG: type II secretion system protein [Sedimentisphaerales bacterium]|nr:type II secretion system protein [Sedimentisphaerales bacterium]